MSVPESASLDLDPAHSKSDAPPEKPGAIRRLSRFLRRLGPAGPLALAATVLPPIGAVCLLGVVTVVAPELRAWRAAPLLCVVAFSLLGGLSLLPTYALSILAGWSFGLAVGFPTALAGHVGASLVAFAVAQRASGGRLLTIIDEKPTWRAVHLALLGSGFGKAVWIITLLRLAPVPPFALTNLILGAAHVRPLRFLAGTTIGMAPHAIVMVVAAVGLHQVSFKAAEQPWLLVAGVLAMITAVIVIGRVARRALEGVARAEAATIPKTGAA